MGKSGNNNKSVNRQASTSANKHSPGKQKSQNTNKKPSGPSPGLLASSSKLPELSQRIYYQLSDFLGQAYNNTSPTSFPYVPGFTVDDLKRKAHSEYSQNHLKGVAVSDLSVYRNIQEFEAAKKGIGIDNNQNVPQPMKFNEILLPSLSDEDIFVVQRPPDPEKVIKCQFELLPSGFETVIDQYVTVASLMIDAPEIKNIISLIEEIDEISADHSPFHLPFIFVDSSSGSGKTQTAFTIQLAFQAKRKVFYLVCPDISEESQDIYQPYGKISNSFNECIDIDLKSVKQPGNSLDKKVYNQELYSYGFIRHLLIHGYQGRDVHIAPCSRDIVLEIIQAQGLNPIVILDEFLSSLDDEKKEKMRLIRNIFRSLGMTVILMGTNSNAVNLVKPSRQSRDGNERLWCYVVSYLPQFQMQLIPQRVPDLFSKILMHSRPWFAKLALEEFEALNFELTINKLEQLCSRIGRKILDEKRIFRHEYGRHGQVCMFLNCHYEQNNSEKMGLASQLIHRHFAQLYNTKTVLCLTNYLKDVETEQPWLPESYIPSPDKDLLLHLTLSGLPALPSLLDEAEEKMTYIHSVQELLKDPMGNRLRLNFDNSAQTTNDEMMFEAVICGSICLASHVNGFKGCMAYDFLNELIGQLGLKMNLNKDWFLKTFPFLKDYKIPFLSPPNQSWPTWIHSVKKSFFGNTIRTQNGDHIDLEANRPLLSNQNNNQAAIKVFLTTECKDYRNTIELNVMKKIISNIPMSKNQRIHLVLTNQLQKSYFQDSSFRDFVSEIQLNQEYCFYRASSGSDVFSTITGIENSTNPSCLVLFVECFPGTYPISPRKKPRLTVVDIVEQSPKTRT